LVVLKEIQSSSGNATKEIERKIAVIFATDVVGYSKSVEKNEDQTIKNFRVCKKILEDLFKGHDGRIFNTAGDSVLAEFSSAVSAVICATEFQRLMKERNESETSDLKWNFVLALTWETSL
jgi:adenylate cyclase